MAADTYSTRWRVLALLGLAELLGMSLWFAASAVTPQLRAIGPDDRCAVSPTVANWGSVADSVAAVLNLLI